MADPGEPGPAPPPLASEQHPCGGSVHQDHPCGGTGNQDHPCGGTGNQDHPCGGTGQDHGGTQLDPAGRSDDLEGGTHQDQNARQPNPGEKPPGDDAAAWHITDDMDAPPVAWEAGLALCHTTQAWIDGPARVHTPLDFVEVFAGAQAISQALAACRCVGMAMDMRYDKCQDVLRPEGLVQLVDGVLRLRHGGLLWAAPPCSSWGWMARNSTGRAEDTAGSWKTNPKVLGQNALAERVAMVLRIMQARMQSESGLKLYWVLENPQNSKLWEFPPVAAAMAACKGDGQPVHSVRTELGAYGACSRKPVVLMGTAPWLPQVARTCTPQRRSELKEHGVKTTDIYVDMAGRKRCQGNADLKASQEYPQGFGAMVAMLHVSMQRLLGPGPAVVGAPQGPLALHHGHAPPSTWRAAGQAAEVFEALPIHYKLDLRHAWFLADFQGHQWVNCYEDELKVERKPKRRKAAGEAGPAAAEAGPTS